MHRVFKAKKMKHYIYRTELTYRWIENPPDPEDYTTRRGFFNNLDQKSYNEAWLKAKDTSIIFENQLLAFNTFGKIEPGRVHILTGDIGVQKVFQYRKATDFFPEKIYTDWIDISEKLMTTSCNVHEYRVVARISEELKEKIEFIKTCYQLYMGFESTERLKEFLNEESTKFKIVKRS